ncbi:EndoU domain-containing protein, partial [Paenibacillus sp. Leaf72]|uniref:EndoU domain-containing protein n=1 Tax=Paenibacillus sp. Leaf72 TaxID=1736234 RepID=UPI001F1B2957
VGARLAAYEEARQRSLPVFFPDGTLITGRTMDENALYHYYISEVYDPCSAMPLDFDAWRLAHYGKTKMESFRDYWKTSGDFILKGNYADEVNAGGVGGSILLGLTGADLPMDVRDLFHNLTNWEWSWGHAGETGLNMLSFFPVVGALKNLRFVDELTDIADVVKELKKMGAVKYTGSSGAIQVLQKLPDGSYLVLDESGKLIKKLDNEAAAFDELGIKIAEGTGKASYSPKLEGHIKYIDPEVPRSRGIGGAHNKVEFYKNDVNVLNVEKHPSMPGVEKVTYQIPSIDGKTGEITGWKAKEYVKTIYDPKVISDEEYIKFGKEAANNALSKGKLGREWEGYDSNGVKWMGYADSDGKVTSFFPEF